MTRIDVSVEIAAPPDRVWNVVEPIENHIDWMHDAVAIRFQTEQTRGIGTTYPIRGTGVRFEMETMGGASPAQRTQANTEFV